MPTIDTILSFDERERLGLVTRTERLEAQRAAQTAATQPPRRGSASGDDFTKSTAESTASQGSISTSVAPDTSRLTAYIEDVRLGRTVISEAGLKYAIDRTWVRLASQGLGTDERIKLIDLIMREANQSDLFLTKLSNAGMDSLGGIERTAPHEALTDQEILNLYGGTGSWIEDDFTDPYSYWSSDELGILVGANVAPGDLGDYPGGYNGYGGTVAPVYRGPDERVIREQIENHLKNVIGEFEDDRVSFLLARYLSDDRANFDSKDKDINPWQTVKELTRTYDDYKQLHKNRPSDMDETAWVASGIAGARAQDVRERSQVERGQVAATVGDINASQRTFQVQQGQQVLPTFFQNAARAAGALGRAVK